MFTDLERARRRDDHHLVRLCETTIATLRMQSARGFILREKLQLAVSSTLTWPSQ